MTQRHILAYDASCPSCSKVAGYVADQHRLEIKALNHPEVMALLNTAKPGWRFQPTLISIDADRVETFTGPSMAARLVMLVGPRKAGKVVKALGEEASNEGTTRRTVLGRGILMTGLMLFGGGTVADPADARSIDVLDAALVARIEGLAAIQRVSGTLGPVERVTYSPGRPNIYILEHQEAHAYSAVDEHVAVAVSYRISISNGDPIVDYLQPDGSLMVRRNLKTGKAEPAGRAARAESVGTSASSATPDISVDCGNYCFQCVQPGHESAAQRAANCAVCTACAGRQAIRCARSCLGSGGMANYALCVSICIGQVSLE
jgi:hypothetical protein